MDLAVRAYVSLVFPNSHFVVNLDDFMIHVDQYPTNSTVPDPWSYTIFVSNDVRVLIIDICLNFFDPHNSRLSL